jgi:thiazole synthase ThiGH ThiG subunit
MRTSIAIAASAAALAVPTAEAWARAGVVGTTVKPKVVIATKSFTGAPGSADRWGEVEVTLVVRRTTTTVGKRVTVKRRITAVRVPIYPNHTGRSIDINSQALPILAQDVLGTQTVKVDLLSGATYTSQGFYASASAALKQALKW